MYNDTVMSHFQNPQNVGEIPDASGIGEIGNIVCGDILRVYIKVKDDRLEDVKYMTYGCAAATASGSMMTSLAKGLTIEEGLKLSNKDVAKALGGLPPEKVHCSNLAADALHKAIRDWQKKTGQLPEGYQEPADSHEHEGEESPVCESQASVDITDVGCPVTVAKAINALDELKGGDVLEVRLQPGEPLQGVPQSFQERGHEVLKTLDNNDGTYSVFVKKSGK